MRVSALADVRLLLETLKGADTAVGEWVNVMGYVTSIRINNTKQVAQCRGGMQDVEEAIVHIQAILLWSAGSVNIGEYEKVLKDRKEVQRRLALR